MQNTIMDLELDYEFECNYQKYCVCQNEHNKTLDIKYQAWLKSEFPGLNLSDSDVTQADRNYYWQWFLSKHC